MNSFRVPDFRTNSSRLPSLPVVLEILPVEKIVQILDVNINSYDSDCPCVLVLEIPVLTAAHVHHFCGWSIHSMGHTRPPASTTDTPLLTRRKRLLKPHLPHVDLTQLVLYIMVGLETALPPGRSSLSRAGTFRCGCGSGSHRRRSYISCWDDGQVR